MSDKKRLIDANELIDYVKRLSFEGGTRTRNIAGNEVLHFHMPNVINKQPTVDAVEVVHGHWIEKEYVDEPYGGYYLFHCSECGIPNARERNYCPNCGAKMDKNDN